MVRDNVIPDDIELTTCQRTAYDLITDWFDDMNELLCGLIGGAGTGKSFLVNLLCKAYKGSIAITAPTHKAKKVVSNFTGRDAETLHSLLGLAPDTSMENFDINNIIFSQKNKPSISMYSLIVLDECSMVNDDLFDYLVKTAQSSGTKILFVGDDAQLPPVNKDDNSYACESKCFSELKTFAVMTTPARQNPTNPLMFLLYALRYDIKPIEENWNAFKFYGQQFLKGRWHEFYESLTTETVLDSVRKVYGDPEVIYTDLYGKVLRNYPNMMNPRTNEGFKHLDNTEFAEHLLEQFRSEEYKTDKNFAKYMAFTNKNVTTWNNYIRNIIFPNVTDIIELGDLVTSYTTINENFNIIFTNSEDYVVTYKEEGFEQVPLIGSSTNDVIEIKGWYAEFESISDKQRTTLFVVNPASMQEFIRAHSYFLAGARKYKKWRQYFAFKNKFALATDLQISNKNKRDLPSKDIDYGYGITVHKSQGSSYEVAFVNIPDIRKYKAVKFGILEAQGKFPGPVDIRGIELFTKKLLYVAYSRAKQRAYGLNG